MSNIQKEVERFIIRMNDVGARFALSRSSLAYQINDNLRSMKAAGHLDDYTIRWPFGDTIAIDYEDADGLYALSWQFQYLNELVPDLNEAYDRAMRGI